MRLFPVAACLGGIFAVPGALADTERVAWPERYAERFTQYTSVDKPHPTRGPSVRDIFVDPEGLAATKAGRPLPSGTVIVMEVHRARQDANKKPLPGSDGKFVREHLFAVFVMEKRDGWGDAHPPSLRNGDWEYARFGKDGARHEDRDMKSCFGCHKAQARNDFVFTLPALKSFTRK